MPVTRDPHPGPTLTEWLRQPCADAGPLPGVVRPADVGGAVAFQVLLREGALRPVRDGVAVPRSRPVDRTVRATTLADLVLPGTVLGGEAAAWVHAGGGAPRHVELVAPAAAHLPVSGEDRSVRRALLLGNEHVLLGGIRVTSVLRTALDVATAPGRGPAAPGHGSRGGPGPARPSDAEVERAAALVVRLCRVCDLDVSGVRRALELRPRWHGRRTARRVLEAASAARPAPGPALA
ncbi:hypothetical protein [Cellulomonas sp. PhB143]|uniref:hypothetical protein n=1 Tax=Cellulomonas sp. PhB143 TaxID=2485186 RepID=UPI000F94ADD8|nr:hypothetical protein [Cellulomonas sp. PhB143]ROS74573.1 hypothetical protein EDF32_2320 [Cellulomonas sp. PhB143]